MDIHNWVEQQWGHTELGDKRRNHRAIKVATAILENPSGSFPEQSEDWGTLKATYRLFNENDVSYESLQKVHRKYVLNAMKQSKVILLIQDGTVLDYTSRDVKLGPIGNHQGQGFCLHTTLAVQLTAGNRKILGLAHQILWKRERTYKGTESRTQRRARHNEAQVWADSVKAIGNTPDKHSQTWVQVGDRGADIFKFLQTCQEHGHEAVIRVVQNRKVEVRGEEGKIREFLKKELPQGNYELIRRGRNGDTKTRHLLQICWLTAKIYPPKHLGKNAASITGTYIRVWESRQGGLEWILFCSLPISNFEEAYEKVDWYSMRWMIEEYHKCLKSGCRTEERYFRSEKALEAVIGMFGILASKLLELKYLVRETEEKKASDVISIELLEIILRRYRLKESEITLKDFWRKVAQLGGFVGRKRDGDPGWQTLWKGWRTLLNMQLALTDLKKCG